MLLLVPVGGREHEEEDDSFTPPLPPHMRKASEGTTTTAHDSEGCQTGRQESNDSESEDESDEYCPALPPHMLQGGSKRPSAPKSPQRRSLVGPMLPKGFAPPTEDPPKECDAKEEREEEEEEEEEEEDTVVGPLPPVNKVNPKEYRALELEERARKMKDKLEGRDMVSNYSNCLISLSILFSSCSVILIKKKKQL